MVDHTLIRDLRVEEKMNQMKDVGSQVRKPALWTAVQKADRGGLTCRRHASSPGHHALDPWEVHFQGCPGLAHTYHGLNLQEILDPITSVTINLRGLGEPLPLEGKEKPT